MLRLAKAFWDIALWRRTPAQLPASLFLLALVAVAAALVEVLSAFLPPASSDRIFTRIALSVGLPLGFACANIWRSALDSRLSVGVAISVGYLLLSMVLEQRLLPDT